ncbi:histidine phosphatase family protein [Neobacillus mesonae]|uniref:Histidine phosphatase family protein n=1 Tax=Neobacillus mesonae TaxID=1193713 RepID=A0A3Q9QR75_9BACI|nr:histidine phosphatase family protein [Neobacillus mesonae]AZU60349.1 histidine phosphatase family protein [Neobacillus mesonae]
MGKKVYVVRHCEAAGQPSESPLTGRGIQQAKELAGFFEDVKVDRIISSPFVRAIQSIEPTAEQKGIKLETDQRLSERVLSTLDLTDWLDRLKAAFDDLDLKIEGGESSREAMNRAVSVLEDVLQCEAENTVIVSHGNLIALLLKYYQPDFGFEQWKNLSNPDVFLLKIDQNNKVSVERLWRS